MAAFTQALARLGWIEGRNLRIDVRLGRERSRPHAVHMRAELVGLQPDVLLANSGGANAGAATADPDHPYRLHGGSDPVVDRFVRDLPARAGTSPASVISKPTIAGKWLELLKEVAPDLKRVAIMFNPDTDPQRWTILSAFIEAAARIAQVEPINAPVRSDAEIERSSTRFARSREVALSSCRMLHTGASRADHIGGRPKQCTGGVSGTSSLLRRAVCFLRTGLVDIFRRAASYVDRILRGAKPTDLPVQLPAKFELASTSRPPRRSALIPQLRPVRADEVIE